MGGARGVEKLFWWGIAEILVFRMYSQELQKWTGASTLDYHLGKVCGKNYLDDESLLNKICGLKKITLKTILNHFGGV